MKVGDRLIVMFKIVKMQNKEIIAKPTKRFNLKGKEVIWKAQEK